MVILERAIEESEEELDLDVFDIADINFRLKKTPRVYRDIYKYRLEPTVRSMKLLGEYCVVISYESVRPIWGGVHDNKCKQTNGYTGILFGMVF